jgi:pimeloyl-ACP methyl ester carboxylesterase
MCGGEHATMADWPVLTELMDVVQSMGTAEPSEWAERQLPLLFTKEWVDANPGIRNLLQLAAQVMPPTPPQTAQRAMEGLVGWSTYDRLPQIRVPVLVVHGDADVVPVDNAYVPTAFPAPTSTSCRAGHGAAQDRAAPVITDFFRRN